MKYKYISIVLIVCLAFVSGCKKSKSDDPTPLTSQEKQKTLLINNGLSWTLGTVTKDGLDVTDQFAGFTLTIGDFTYVTENALASAWPSQGTWSFANEAGTLVDRNDGVQVTVSVSTTSLKLTFNVAGLGDGGRVKGVDGTYIFDLIPG